MLLCKHIKLTNCVHVLSLIQGSFAFCFHYDGRVMKLFFFTCTGSWLGVQNGTAANCNGFIHLTSFTFLTLSQGTR